jgi:hypothetical protein
MGNGDYEWLNDMGRMPATALLTGIPNPEIGIAEGIL